MHCSKRFLIAASVFAIVSTAAHAQTSSDPAIANPEDAGVESSDIVVTAQKRAESLQRVPIAITALSASMLQDQQVVSTVRLETAVPNLVFGNATAFGLPFLRGVGSTASTIGGEAAVATYVDGIYISSILNNIFEFVDVERVEVLKGPQGTLYGRNAVGGAINVITKQPQDTFEGAANIGYGNFDTLEGQAYISGGVAENLALGLYVSGKRKDSFYTNLSPVRSPDELTKSKQYGIKGKAVLTPSESSKFSLTLERAYSDDSDGFSDYQTIDPIAIGVVAGSPISNKPRRFYGDWPAFAKSRLWAASLRGEIEMPFATLVSITGYRDFKSYVSSDTDATDRRIFSINSLPQSSKQFSQELQLISSPTSPIKWIGGLYFFDEKTAASIGIQSGATIFTQLFPRLPVRAYAAYGQITVPLAEGLNVTAGLRYSDEEKSIRSSRTIAALNQFNVQLPSQSKSWKRPTWRLALDYQVSPDVLAYISYNRGFQSGLFTGTNSAAPPLDPQTLDAFEIGLKTELLDRRVRANFATFLYNFKNLQASVIPPSGIAQFINVGSARIYGFEADLNAAVTNNFRLLSNIGYLHSEYRDSPNYSGFVPAPSGVGYVSGVFNVTGNSLGRAPKLTTNVGGNYSADLGEIGTLDLNASWYHSSSYFFDPAHLTRQPAYDLANASVKLSPNEHYSITAWVQNLFDKTYLRLDGINANGRYRTYAAPRTYGVKLAYEF